MSDIQSIEELRQARPKILELARRYRGREVWVFGSCARGEFNSESDIDFLVEFESDFRLTDVIRLKQGLENLLGRKVDVVPKHALRKELEEFALAEMQAL